MHLNTFETLKVTSSKYGQLLQDLDFVYEMVINRLGMQEYMHLPLPITAIRQSILESTPRHVATLNCFQLQFSWHFGAFVLGFFRIFWVSLTTVIFFLFRVSPSLVTNAWWKMVFLGSNFILGWIFFLKKSLQAEVFNWFWVTWMPMKPLGVPGYVEVLPPPSRPWMLKSFCKGLDPRLGMVSWLILLRTLGSERLVLFLFWKWEKFMRERSPRLKNQDRGDV